MKLAVYRRTSISGPKKKQITFPLRHFFPLKVVPLIEVLFSFFWHWECPFFFCTIEEAITAHMHSPPSTYQATMLEATLLASVVWTDKFCSMLSDTNRRNSREEFCRMP
jgi:hypothetical protein